MTSVFTGFSATTTFPDHDICFGDSKNTSAICQIPTTVMINFLNITTSNAYIDICCDNPPVDSCAFGYCPNPDVARFLCFLSIPTRASCYHHSQSDCSLFQCVFFSSLFFNEN